MHARGVAVVACAGKSRFLSEAEGYGFLAMYHLRRRRIRNGDRTHPQLTEIYLRVGELVSVIV
jgi:hypothetical protein